MKWEDLRRSDNVDDRRGQTPRPRQAPRSMNQSSSGLSNMFLYLLFRRGGGKWILILFILFALFGGLFNSNSNSTNYNPPIEQVNRQNQPAASVHTTDVEFDFMSAVLGNLEDFWDEAFNEYGLDYHPPTLVIYDDYVQTSGCGFSDAAVGPFYCGADESVYIDLSFFRDLAEKYDAPGEFAMAYVLAHEVGHHIQNELGTLGEYHRAIQSMSERDRNALNVRLELQADYYAGAWARYADDLGLLEIGDLEDAIRAAEAVGDDTIQKKAYGRVVPDSFTHGTAKQRMAWFEHGYSHGDIEHGDTFNQTLPNEH